jgi:hypothetical protein
VPYVYFRGVASVHSRPDRVSLQGRTVFVGVGADVQLGNASIALQGATSSERSMCTFDCCAGTLCTMHGIHGVLQAEDLWNKVCV